MALAVSACVLGVSGWAQAADFTVTSGADSGPGTYRNAVNQANAAPGADRILFAVPAVTLNVGLSVTDSTQIGGAGQPVTISGADSQFFGGVNKTDTIGANVTITRTSVVRNQTAVQLSGSTSLFVDGTIRPASPQVSGIDIQGSGSRLFLGATSLIETGIFGTGISGGSSARPLLVSLNGGTIRSGNIGINLANVTNAGMSGGVIEAGSIGVILGPGSGWTTGLLGGRITGGSTGILLQGGPSDPRSSVGLSGGIVESPNGVGIAASVGGGVGVSEGGTVTGKLGISSGAGDFGVTVGGTVVGTNGTAIQFGSGNDTFVLWSKGVIDGKVIAGAGTDKFTLGGAENGTFNVSEIGPSGKFQGFELFEKSNFSTWTLTGSGNQNWAILSGTLRGDTNGLQGNLTLSGGTLVIDQAFDGTFAGGVSGFGLLVKRGTGRVELPGTYPKNDITLIEGGTLGLTGALPNSRVEIAGGVLEGTGSAGALAVLGPRVGSSAAPDEKLPGGTVAPGGATSFGTLTVGGLVVEDGATYRVKVNAAGQSDRIVVTRPHLSIVGPIVHLEGGTVQVLAEQGLYRPQTTYTILTAAPSIAEQSPLFAPPVSTASIEGRFGAVFTNLAFLIPELAYTDTDVTLTLRRNDINFREAAATPNQAAAGRAAEALGFGNPVFNAILGLTAPEARGAFDLLSGEVHASAVTAAVEESRLVRDAVLDRLRGLGMPAGGTAGGQAQSAFAAYAADAPGPHQAIAVPVRTIDPRAFAVWGQSFGSWGRTDGDAGTAALKRSSGGFILGADATFDERWRAGFAGGYTRTSIDVDARLASGAIESVHGAVYGGASLGAVQLRAGAAIAGQDVSTTRTVAFRGFAESLRAAYDQTVLQAFGEAGYRIGLGLATVEPFAQLAALRLNTDGFREDGGAAALSGLARTHDVGFSTLGVRAEGRLAEMPLVARGMLGWRHAFGDVTPAALVSFGGGALPFLAAGAPVARNSLVAEAGLDYRITPFAAVGVSYAGAVAEDARDHALKGRFEMQF
ncbi:MAG TPA: autotransporter domain-containing protein [Beijerinckiaceae bacterium]